MTPAFMLLGSAALFCQSGSDRPIYLDASQPISKRVEDLLNKMTLKEKVGQLNIPSVDNLG